MAYEFLKKLFGEPKDGEAPKAMTFDELAAALDGASDIQVVNLKDGGYVSKEKFDAKNTELTGVKQQLTDANAQIQSFKGKEIDVDAANQKVAEWEAKYNADTQALNDQLATQARSHAEDMFMSGYKFTSKAARNGVLADFREQKFTLDENGVFRGGKEYMDSLMKMDDYKGAFITETEGGEGGQQGQNSKGGQQQPRFAGSTPGVASQQNNANSFNFGFTRLRQPPANQ